MKYKPEVIDVILDALRKGNGRLYACGKAGITFETFSQWLNDEAKPEFSEGVKKAETEGYSFDEEQYRGVIKKAAAGGTWQAAAWMLERKHAYTAKINQNISGELNIKCDPFEKIRQNTGVDAADKKTDHGT